MGTIRNTGWREASAAKAVRSEAVVTSKCGRASFRDCVRRTTYAVRHTTPASIESPSLLGPSPRGAKVSQRRLVAEYRIAPHQVRQWVRHGRLSGGRIGGRIAVAATQRLTWETLCSPLARLGSGLRGEISLLPPLDGPARGHRRG